MWYRKLAEVRAAARLPDCPEPSGLGPRAVRRLPPALRGLRGGSAPHPPSSSRRYARRWSPAVIRRKLAALGIMVAGWGAPAKACPSDDQVAAQVAAQVEILHLAYVPVRGAVAELPGVETTLDTLVPCLKPSFMADYHYARALVAFRSDRDAALRAWRAVLRFDPHRELPDIFGARHGMRTLRRAASQLQDDEGAPLPRGRWWVDGSSSARRVPTYRAFALVERDKKGTTLRANYHFRASEVDAEPSRKGSVRLGLGMGLAVLGGGLVAWAAVDETGFRDVPLTTSEDFRADVNRRYAIGAASAGVGLVLTTAGAVARWR